LSNIKEVIDICIEEEKEKASELNRFVGFREIQISGKEFIKFLQTLGFIVVRVNGSHHRIMHPDGRVTTLRYTKAKTS